MIPVVFVINFIVHSFTGRICTTVGLSSGYIGIATHNDDFATMYFAMAYI